MLSRQALALGRRNASAFAATTLAAPEEKISRLPNGLTVASVDLEGALSQLVLAFRAGSRYESRDEAGLVHHIRNAVGKDSTGFTGINLLWTTGSIGAQLTATATRDVLAVRVATSRDRAGVALSLLGHLGAQPAFKPWELEDVSETLVEDNKNATAHERLIEALHSAAFRSGNLANSVLADPDSVGKHNYKAFQAYAKRRLVSGEAVLVGVNVDHSLLLEYATQQAPINEGRGGNAEASPYIGGESRVEAGGKVAYVALAGAGASLADSQGVATQAVLSQSATLRYGSPSAGTVAKAAFKAGALGVSAVNELHSDAGLAGVYLVGNASNIGGAVTAAASALKSLRVDDAALGAAKARAQVALQTRAESGSVLALDRAIQIAATGAAVSPADFASQISQVKAADVNKAIEKLASKLSIASYGAVANVPYRDQL